MNNSAPRGEVIHTSGTLSLKLRLAHFPECYTGSVTASMQGMLRLAFIFQSAILAHARSYQRVALRLAFIFQSAIQTVAGILFLPVAVGFHFPECYTRHTHLQTRRQLRLAFIFQSAIPKCNNIFMLPGCGWLSFSRVLYW